MPSLAVSAQVLVDPGAVERLHLIVTVALSR
jgi:hypothetical protein